MELHLPLCSSHSPRMRWRWGDPKAPHHRPECLSKAPTPAGTERPRGSLTCRQGDVAVEAALVDAVAGVVAAHDGWHCTLTLLVAQPHAAVALGAVGLVRALIACRGAPSKERIHRAGNPSSTRPPWAWPPSFWPRPQHSLQDPRDEAPPAAFNTWAWPRASPPTDLQG